MAADTRELDLASLRLSPGEGRRLALRTPVEPLLLGGERYRAQAGDGSPEQATVDLDVSRMTAAAMPCA